MLELEREEEDMMVDKPRAPRRAAARAPHPALDETLLTRIEDEWLAERHRGGTRGSETLLHDDYVGGSSGGERATKQSFLARVGNWSGGKTQTRHSERVMRQFGDSVISTGVASVSTAGREHRYRYLRVYHWLDGAWRLVASQSAALA